MAALPIEVQEASPQQWVLRIVGFLLVAYYFVGPIFAELKPNEFGERTAPNSFEMLRQFARYCGLALAEDDVKVRECLGHAMW